MSSMDRYWRSATVRLALEFRPIDTLLLRANYATSFKAPDMHYVFSEPSGSFGTVTDFLSADSAAPST